MDELEEVWLGLVAFTTSHGLLSIAAMQFLKSAGVPLPVPLALLMVLLGVQARDGTISLWVTWVALTASSVLGAAALFGLVRWISPADLLRYGRFIGLTEPLLKRAEVELNERGQPAIFLARLLPGLGLAIVVVCAVLRLPFRKFWPAVTVAALAYTGASLLLGFAFGPAVIDTIEQIAIPIGLLVRLTALVILVVWLVRARKGIGPRPARPPSSPGLRFRAGAFAGILAVSGATTFFNALIYAAGPVADRLLTPSGTVIGLVSRFPGELLYFVMLVVVVTALGIAWGVLYGGLEDRFAATWPDWQHGLLFAIVPFAMSLVAVVPVVIYSAAESAERWLIAAVAEALLWAIYGILLGLTYPIFNAYARSKEDADAPSAALTPGAMADRG